MPKNTFLNLNIRKRKKILNSLIKYFANNTYEKVDIEDIAKECKVSKGSMYQYFINKKDMYFYAINESIKKMFKIIEYIDFEKIDLFEYLENSFESNWILFSKYPNEYLLLEKSIFSYEAPFKDEINVLFSNKFREILKMIIIKSQKNGVIRDDLTCDLILNFMEGAVMNFKRYIIEYAKNRGISYKDLSLNSIKDLNKGFIELLKNGLKK